MSKIDYQALREAAVAIETVATPQKLLAFRMKVTPQVVLALLDERERNQQYIKRRDQENEEIALTVGKLRVELGAAENNLIDSECHVAELEEALRDKQALLEASEKRIAELEAELVSQTYKLNELSGNSLVTPDGWISCSERMPKMGERQCYVLAADFKNTYTPNIPNTQVGVYGDWFNDGNPTWDDGDGEDLYLKEVTHWMPLPEPPQEVRQ
ncbi:TPA: ead/Ea22-like family protein [Escherichia coli]|uniref:ead/Ea22-like family protein n=1 Tax=Escherichia coli TaxID=562 RepID=UPI0008FFD815|nr:ead/Ea22-like family protein [Escherichia coli]HDX3840133.1 ead/Ea22-like family protein [Escherichia coli]HDX3871759.1 ead/Ea22-like family protein [Escherichia coli]HEA8329572.1 ead/Ea22-like family protein [Escherichia coli]HEA8338739.1 ead/Ea22-like family protein [Escherichia coli]HEA8455125.1 ead/Ea22-like family protein [Escherichia coli]